MKTDKGFLADVHIMFVPESYTALYYILYIVTFNLNFFKSLTYV